MSEEKTTKRTKKTKTKSSTKSSGNRVVWLFGVHDRIPQNEVLRTFNPRSKTFLELRETLGVKLGSTVLPVFPGTKDRLEVIERLEEADLGSEVVILVVGQSEDLQNSKLSKFKDHQAVLIHPSERQYYLDTGISSSGAYRKANEKLDGLEEKLSKLFSKVIQ